MFSNEVVNDADNTFLPYGGWDGIRQQLYSITEEFFRDNIFMMLIGANRWSPVAHFVLVGRPNDREFPIFIVPFLLSPLVDEKNSLSGKIPNAGERKG